MGDIAKERSVVGDGGVLHLDWNLNSTFENGGVTALDVARGKTDGYIRRFARDLRNYGRPVLMTLFNGEFNGSWWTSVSPRANPYLTTADFVRGWRRVVDIFHAVGATNVSFAWVLAAYPEDGPHDNVDSNIAAYYPGDDYVDWVGVDVYDVGLPNWMDGPYAFAVAHGKPVFVGEFGIRHEWSSQTPQQHYAWLGEIFDYFASHPAIKAISYFNFCNRAGATHVPWDPTRSIYIDGGSVNYVPDVNDHDHRLLAGGPAIQALFASRISSPRYVATISTENVVSTPAVATATLLMPKLSRRTAIVRWQGNLAADRFDLAVKRGGGSWQVALTATSATTQRLRGRARESIIVRVRASDVDGNPGPWSAARRIVLARR
jgi:glycosyl hydrolase family 26